jgi:hypothetical protein
MYSLGERESRVGIRSHHCDITRGLLPSFQGLKTKIDFVILQHPQPEFKNETHIEVEIFSSMITWYVTGTGNTGGSRGGDAAKIAHMLFIGRNQNGNLT